MCVLFEFILYCNLHLASQQSTPKVPLSSSVTNALYDLFEHENGEILFEGIFEFIEASINNTTLPSFTNIQR